MTAFVANTNVLELIGLKDEVAEAFINDATVTVTIKDILEDEEVEGETWPLAMVYVTASDGDYRAILSDELSLVAKRKYLAYIDADGGADLIGHWEFHFSPKTRAA